MLFFVKLKDTKEQRTANEQNQPAWSITILALARNDQTDLRLHCFSFSALLLDSPAKKRKSGIRNPR